MTTSTGYPTAGTVRGYFRIDEGLQLLRGWACDTAHADRALLVDILVDGRPRASCLADNPRGDLARLGTGNLKYGFALHLGELGLEAGREYAIAVRTREGHVDLDGECEYFTARATESSAATSVSAHTLDGPRVHHEVQVVPLRADRWVGRACYRRQIVGLERNGLDESNYYEQHGDADWAYRKTISDVEFNDALVIMPFGIVIADGRVIHESTYLMGANATYPLLSPRDESGSLRRLWRGLSHLFGRDLLPRYRLNLVPHSFVPVGGTAFLLASPAYRSYYHWHIDTLPAITRVGKLDSGRTEHILCPAPLTPWHKQSLARLQAGFPLPCPLSFYNALQVLRVDTLHFTTGLGGNRSFLSPDICAFYEALTGSAADRPPAIDTGTRLYLSRRSHSRRRLENEAVLEEALRQRGFHCIDPGQFDYATQIEIFRRADTIVAPHGAALTNLIFSRKGVRVLELMPDRYINLGLQRIANLKEAEYGYAVGSCRDRDAAQTPHDLSYTIDVDDVLAIVDAW